MPPEITDATTVVRSKGQISTTLGGEVVILSIEDGVYYGLTDVGARLWALVEAPRRLGELADAVTAEYEVTRDEATADVRALVADLAERGLVVVSDVVDR